MSTQPCIPRGLLSRVPALAGCKGENVNYAGIPCGTRVPIAVRCVCNCCTAFTLPLPVRAGSDVWFRSGTAADWHRWLIGVNEFTHEWPRRRLWLPTAPRLARRELIDS